MLERVITYFLNVDFESIHSIVCLNVLLEHLHAVATEKLLHRRLSDF
jgi:hypothetical protein